MTIALSPASLHLRALALLMGLAAAAALCGALASGGVFAAGILTLTMAMVLVAALAALWHVVAHTDWRAAAESWRAWNTGLALPTLPYAQSGSDAAKMTGDLGQFADWLRRAFVPAYAGPLLLGMAALVIGGVMAASLAEISGMAAALLTVVAISLAQVAVVACRGNGRPNAVLQGIVLVALPIMLGYGAYAPLALGSVIVALAFGCVAASVLDDNLGLRHLGYGLAVLTMVVTRQPVGAFALSVIWLPQWRAPAQETSRGARVEWGWMFAGLVVFALGFSM